MQTLLQDLRYGVRRLARKPGFTVVVVLTWRSGLARIPPSSPSSIRSCSHRCPMKNRANSSSVKETNPARTTEPNSVSPGNFLDLHEQTSVFESITAWYETASTLQGEQDAEQVASVQVSVDFFKVLRVRGGFG